MIHKKNLSYLWGEALVEDDKEVFISDYALSSIWGDPEDITDEELMQIADFIGSVWDAAHRNMRQIVKSTNLSQAKFANLFAIPKRTVEDWCRGISSPPDYVRLMIQLLLKMI